jgi:HlyD family secretion protein
MLRQVRGPGTLVPEEILNVTARTAGRVERVLVLAGAQVTSETVLVELSNPDLQLQVQNAYWDWKRAEAGYTDLEVRLETQRLQQVSQAAAVQADYTQARLTAERDQELYDEGLTSQLNLELSQTRAAELSTRNGIEQQRLEILASSIVAQLAAQKAQVDQRAAEYELRSADLDALSVRPQNAGVLQQMDLEPGTQVTPGMVLARVVEPTRLKAELRIAQTQAKDIALQQIAWVDTRNGIIEGRVSRIDPAVEQGTVTVDVRLLDDLPPGARPDLSVDGRIEIEKLDDVLYMDRPAFGQAESTVGLFKLIDDGSLAVRVNVRLGRSSVNEIEVVEGLSEGDEVILSDMSRYDAVDRVRIR